MAFRMRRAPLLRGALLMGGAAAMGHRAGTRGAQEAAQEQTQNEQIQELQARQDQHDEAQHRVAEAAASPDSLTESDEPAGTDDDAIAKLTQLATLRRQDLINDDEYAAAKAKLLGI